METLFIIGTLMVGFLGIGWVLVSINIKLATMKVESSNEPEEAPMRIKAIYIKNLKMSEGKIASQVAHAVKNLGLTPINSDIIVLAVSRKKFSELIAANSCYVQTDKGLTEVEQGTQTAAAWIELR